MRVWCGNNGYYGQVIGSQSFKLVCNYLSTLKSASRVPLPSVLPCPCSSYYKTATAEKSHVIP